jgi:beta-glucosidase
VKQLAGFRRVHLKAGETTTVEFPIGPAALSLIDAAMHPVVEPGLFDIMVGPSSAKTETITLEVKAK